MAGVINPGSLKKVIARDHIVMATRTTFSRARGPLREGSTFKFKRDTYLLRKNFEEKRVGNEDC